MSDHMNLFSQRIYQEHPTFNWALQHGDNDESTGGYVYSVAFGYPPVDYNGSPENGTGVVRYESADWDRDRIPMVVGSNGTTIVVGDTPEFEANRFLNVAGRHDTFVFEFWMRIVNQGSNRIKILESNYQDKYGLYLTGTVLTFVYGKTFCSYDVEVVDVPIYVGLFTHATGIGFSINGEQVAFSEIADTEKNHDESDEGNSGFDFHFVDIDGAFFEVDGPSVFGYSQDAEISKRRYVWGQGAGDVQAINNNFNGQSAFANFNASELPAHSAYPLNYRWESGAKDNLVIWQDKLSLRYPKLPVHSFDDDTTEEDWFDDQTGTSFVYSQGINTTFDRVGDYIENPVSMFFKGTGYQVTITSVFYPGYEVVITPSFFQYRIDSTQGFSNLNFSFGTNFIMRFDKFDPDDSYELWNMFQQPEGLKVTISDGTVEGLGFGSSVQRTLDGDDSDSFIETWSDDPNPTYFWKGSDEFGFFYEDVELRGYWEDYIPYKTLAAIDESGEFNIDHLQFNMSHREGGVEAFYQWSDTVGVYPSLDESEATSVVDHTAIQPANNSVLRLYLKFETDGYFTTPYQLNKLSVSTYLDDIVKTKGLSIDKHDGNFLYDTDSMPFLTLGKNSGFCSDESFDVLMDDVENVGAIQFFVRINDESDATLASFSGNSVTKTGNTLSSSGGKLIVNGEEVDESDGKPVEVDEWHCVALVFDNAVDESDGSISLAPEYNFDNIGYFLNTSDMVQTMKNVWQAYTMSEALQFTSYQPMELIQNDIAAYPGISWQQTDIEPL